MAIAYWVGTALFNTRLTRIEETLIARRMESEIHALQPCLLPFQHFCHLSAAMDHHLKPAAWASSTRISRIISANQTLFIVESSHFAELTLSSLFFQPYRSMRFCSPQAKYFPDSYNASTNTIQKIKAPVDLTSFQGFNLLSNPHSRSSANCQTIT